MMSKKRVSKFLQMHLAIRTLNDSMLALRRLKEEAESEEERRRLEGEIRMLEEEVNKLLDESKEYEE
jgi:hypothetical protein